MCRIGTGIFETIDFNEVEKKVRRLFRKVTDFEESIGVPDHQLTNFRENPETTPLYATSPGFASVS